MKMSYVIGARQTAASCQLSQSVALTSSAGLPAPFLLQSNNMVDMVVGLLRPDDLIGESPGMCGLCCVPVQNHGSIQPPSKNTKTTNRLISEKAALTGKEPWATEKKL